MFRIVCTLIRQGFLLHELLTRGYALGSAVLRLDYGVLRQRNLVGVDLPMLGGLRDVTGWSAYLAVRVGREALHLLRVPQRLARQAPCASAAGYRPNSPR